jgi:hypothetical protein
VSCVESATASHSSGSSHSSHSGVQPALLPVNPHDEDVVAEARSQRWRTCVGSPRGHRGVDPRAAIVAIASKGWLIVLRFASGLPLAGVPAGSAAVLPGAARPTPIAFWSLSVAESGWSATYATARPATSLEQALIDPDSETGMRRMDARHPGRESSPGYRVGRCAYSAGTTTGPGYSGSAPGKTRPSTAHRPYKPTASSRAESPS